MSKFKVGDKVRAKKNAPYEVTTDGWEGTVTRVCDDDGIWVFGKPFEGELGVCVNPQWFDLVEEKQPAGNKIVITTDGKTTTAVLYEGKQRIKSAKAKCAPHDTFDFSYGANLALDRLMGNPRIAELKSRLNSIYGRPFIDWNKFAHGKLSVKVNREKYDEFIKMCEVKNFKWNDGMLASKVNPWNLYDDMNELAKAIVNILGDVPDEFIYISFVPNKDALRWHNKPHEEYDIYEFI